MRTLATVVFSLAAVLAAQTPEPPPIPYVASVKVNASGSGSSFTRRLPGGTRDTRAPGVRTRPRSNGRRAGAAAQTE